MLSATPDEESMRLVEEKKTELVCLFERPHKHPLIVPKVIQVSVFLQVLIVIYECIKFCRDNKQTLVFVPRKRDGTWLKMILNLFVKTSLVHSSTENKDEILDCFRNKELDVLISSLNDSLDLLNVGGRLAVITFHSLEDKIVKDTFRKVSETDSLSKGLPNIPEDKLPDFKIITKKGIVPTDKEEEENHRAHSARLRVIERIK